MQPQNIELHDYFIRTDDYRYDFVEQLWINAFPENERRDIAEQRYNVDHNPRFFCLFVSERIADYSNSIGFLTFWDFQTFCYVEHFAIDPKQRNKGIGGSVLRDLVKYIGKPFVLEVEIPDDDFRRRRVEFYRRNGFTLWQKCLYFQPPYRPSDTSLPMLLMATPDLDPKTDFQHIAHTIHREVYGYEQ